MRSRPGRCWVSSNGNRTGPTTPPFDAGLTVTVNGTTSSHIANVGFDMMLAEQAATARDNWAFHKDLGFFGYYSNRMRGVISGTDGTGGFELEDIDVA